MNQQVNSAVLGSPPSANQIEQIGPGVTLEWLYEGRIGVLAVSSVERQAIDCWSKTAISLLAERPPDQPHLVVHDVSADGLALTPYIRKKARETVGYYPDAPGRTAVVVRRGAVSILMQLFVNSLAQLIRGRPTRVFFSREDAVSWLAELLDS